MLKKIARRVASRIDRYNRARQLHPFRKIVGPGLRRDQVQRLALLQDDIGFGGKSVLEIGGDLKGNVARACLALGADHVTSINHDAAFEPLDSERISRRRMDATSLDLPANSFDFVIGFAVIEHIRGLEETLSGIHRVTKRGGHVLLHGGPLWFSKKGHHLIVDGPSGRKYRFDGAVGSENPLEGWDHLTKDPATLADTLIERGCPREDSDAIVEYVYGTDLINRYPSSHIKKCSFDSAFTVQRWVESTDPETRTETLALLEKRHSLPESEFRTRSVDILLHKA